MDVSLNKYNVNDCENQIFKKRVSYCNSCYLTKYRFRYITGNLKFAKKSYYVGKANAVRNIIIVRLRFRLSKYYYYLNCLVLFTLSGHVHSDLKHKKGVNTHFIRHKISLWVNIEEIRRIMYWRIWNDPKYWIKMQCIIDFKEIKRQWKCKAM